MTAGTNTHLPFVQVGIPFFLSLMLLISPVVMAGSKKDLPKPNVLLMEARALESAIQDSDERLSTLERIAREQIRIDPDAARSTLKSFPKIPHSSHHLVSLASLYAQAGNIAEAEHMYAEIRLGDRSPQGIQASAEAYGQVAVAYANAGKIEEAFQTLSQLRALYREQSPTIQRDATAQIVRAQAKQGDVQGALRTAATIAKDNPIPLMTVIGERIRDGNTTEALEIVSGFEQWLQDYANWGIVLALRDQGYLRAAQVTASAMQPGHAKANALLALAIQHTKQGSQSTASILLQEARTAADSIGSDETKADLLWHIAAAMAEAGDADGAREIANAIGRNEQQFPALRDIVNAQAAQGDIPGAFNTAFVLNRGNEPVTSDLTPYAFAIADILTSLVKTRSAKEALNAVRRFGHLKPQHYLFYSRIATAQAERGDIKGAFSSLSLIETKAQRAARKKQLIELTQQLNETQDPDVLAQLTARQAVDHEIGQAYEAITVAQARKGLQGKATKTATTLVERPHQNSVFERMGSAQVEAGRARQALTWARSLSSPSNKAYALVGIAKSLAEQKDSKRLKKYLREYPSTRER
ncbi:MAG TPA: hypothetical protein VIR79_01265 [Nitrospira sp.]